MAKITQNRHKYARFALLLGTIAMLANCGTIATPARTDSATHARRASSTDIFRSAEARPNAHLRNEAMIAAADPRAVDAGITILDQGGSAIDAAIAVQAMLGLVEPQSSGIGGGAFMVYYDAATGDVTTYDGREVAPAAAFPTMFLDANGRPKPFWDAVKSGHSTGVPGAVAMLEMAHKAHGKLAWATPWAPAAQLARDGFIISPRMASRISGMAGTTQVGPGIRDYLFDGNGAPLPAGALIKNPTYAQTLDAIAQGGAQAFYHGPIAQEIVAAVQGAEVPGTLSLDDLANYQPQERQPICRPYRVHLVCGMGPPSSGGIGVLATLGLLANFDMPALANDQVGGYHLLIEAQRLAYADRDTYVADDRFVQVPIDGLLDRTYLATRAGLINPNHAMAQANPGNPPGAVPRGRDGTGNVYGTTHFVIVDYAGNVVSMTTTVEAPFGSQRMAAGFFLNNQLTDFSFAVVDANGQAIANAPAPGKKPRSSMSPTIVFDQAGQFELAVGSPGGNAIIGYVAKALVALLDWNMPVRDALGLPNVIGRTLPIDIERNRADPALLTGLTARGQQLSTNSRAEGSGLSAVRLRNGHLEGSADPRGEGAARLLTRR